MPQVTRNKLNMLLSNVDRLKIGSDESYDQVVLCRVDFSQVLIEFRTYLAYSVVQSWGLDRRSLIRHSDVQLSLHCPYGRHRHGWRLV